MMRRARIVFGMLLAVLLMNSSGNADLVGYWPLDGDATDLSTSGIDGSLEGDVAFSDDVPDALGGGMSLIVNAEAVADGGFPGDGDIIDPGYVDLGNPDVLNFADNDWTVAAWMKVPELLGPRGNIFSNGGDNGGGVRYVLAYDETGNEGITLTTDDNSDKRQATSDGLEIPVNDEAWHHVVGQREGNELRVYIDGEFAAENLDVPDGYDLSDTEQQPAYIGLGADSGSGAFEKFLQGWVDDVAVFDHALTEDEIIAIMGGDFSAYGIGGGDPGDFDKNGVLDVVDLDALIADIMSPSGDAAFDLNSDGSVDKADLDNWVSDLKNTYIGDANLDGEFNSGDFVQVFTAGEYETGQPATWGQGDWNADGVFNSGDFVDAFSAGGYENGPRPAAAAVPEPSSLVLLLLGSLCFIRRK